MDIPDTTNATPVARSKASHLILILCSLLVVSNAYYFYTYTLNGSKKQQEVQLADKPSEIATDTAPTLELNANSAQYLLEYNEDRGVEACGHQRDVLLNKLVISGSDQESGTRLSDGVWSNDCSVYVYGVQPHYLFPQKAEALSGYWGYYPKTDTNTRLLRVDPVTGHEPLVYRFISPNLVSVQFQILDIKNKKIVDQYDTNWDLVTFVQDGFDWSFLKPHDWHLRTNVSDQNSLTFDIARYDGTPMSEITFYSQPVTYDLVGYSQRTIDLGSKGTYKLYYFPDPLPPNGEKGYHQTQPEFIYLYEGEGHYPPVITIDVIDGKDKNDAFYLDDLLETIVKNESNSL